MTILYTTDVNTPRRSDSQHCGATVQFLQSSKWRRAAVLIALELRLQKAAQATGGAANH